MKSTLLKFFLTLSAVLLFGVNASAQGTTALGDDGFPTGESSDPIKFFFSVTGFSQLGGLGAQSTVYATVFDGNQDYNFEVVLPNKNNIVCSDQATVRAMMRNVASLNVGANETRKHEVTINTQTSVSTQKLGGWLPKTYQFQGATLPITVVDYNHGETIKKEFTYTLSGASHGENGWRITGVRNNFQDAHDAWYLITKGPNEDHVTADRKGDEDSFLYLPAGAYVQMYNGRVTASSAVSMSEGNFDLAALRQMFSTVETVANPEEKAVFYLPQGTKLTIGASYATLNEPAWITVDLTKMPQSKTLKDVLSNLKTASKDNSSFIQAFLQMFDGLVEAVDLAGEVPVEVRFGEPAFIQVFKGQETPETTLRTPAQFAEDLKEYPNAVGYVWSNLNGVNYATPTNIAIADQSGVQNIVIDYPVGKKGHYYECNNLILVDYVQGPSKENINFYTPQDFNAIKLSYSRTILASSGNYNSVCLPFAFSSSNVGNGEIYTFSNYNETASQVYFTKQNVVDAGIPCIVKTVQSTWNVSLTNADVVANPIESTNMKGSFVKDNVGVGEGTKNFYKLNGSGEKYQVNLSTSNCYPFRSYLVIDTTMGPGVPGSSNAKVLDIVFEDESTAISSMTSDCIVESVYSLSGTKLSKVQKGVNLLKMTDGTIKKVIVK